METLSEKLNREACREVREWLDYLNSPAANKVKAFGERIDALRPQMFEPELTPADGYTPGTVEVRFAPRPTRPAQKAPLVLPPDPPTQNWETSTAGSHATASRAEWEKILLHETGKVGKREELEKAERRNFELERLSHELADKLESQGIEAYDRNEWRSAKFFPISRTLELTAPFRRINLIPTVAKAHRAKLVRALSYQLELFPFARMFTFTNGLRVPLSNLRDSIQAFHRRLSKLACWMKKKLGIEMFWRSTELGTPRNFDIPEEIDKAAGTLERNEAGEVTFHVHSHCCVRFVSGKPFSKEDWEGVKLSIKSRWKWHWDDSGMVGRNSNNSERSPSALGAQELVKYVTKPGELDKLTPEEIGKLYHELRLLRLITPMGSLKAQLKAKRDECQTLRREQTPDGPVWGWAADWNRTPDTGKPKLGDSLAATEGALAVANLDQARQSGETLLLAALPPSYPRGRRVKEPSFRLLFKQWNEAEVLQIDAIRDTIALVSGLFKAGEQLAAASDAAEVLPLGSTRGNQLSTELAHATPPPRPKTLPEKPEYGHSPPDPFEIKDDWLAEFEKIADEMANAATPCADFFR